MQEIDMSEIYGSQWLFQRGDDDPKFTPEYGIRRLMLPLYHNYLFTTADIHKDKRYRISINAHIR